ncbi:MAG: 2-hydroxyacyl-CoA dehydratase family protein [candidate division WOR-3 bacterium]
MLNDPEPKRITLVEWSEQFKKIDEHTIKRFTYYNNPQWGIYLSPPATFMVYGARELKRLKFDNSLAALRMWGFVFNESERLFRAKQIGKRVIATMGDLGIVPTIIMAFPDCVPFYPECIWWTPFFRESKDLLNTATMLGAPEAACFVRAALASFFKKAYFPRPDLLIGATGASCDDYSCVMQLVEDLGYDIFWVEIPLRKSPSSFTFMAKGAQFEANKKDRRSDIYENTAYNIFYHKNAERYLISEYQRIWDKMVELTGVNNKENLMLSIKKANRLRELIERIKDLCANAPVAPFPSLELMTIEFGNLYGYADFDEWIDIIEMIYSTVRERVNNNTGVLDREAIPIAWVSPSADPYMLNLIEDMGCRVVATEYVINQALVKIEEDIEPIPALARAFLNASLIGSTRERVRRLQEKIDAGLIRGVLITNSFGASHCAMETRLIEKMLGKVPVLAIDIPEPFGIGEQIRTRLEAFVEMIR